MTKITTSGHTATCAFANVVIVVAIKQLTNRM